MKAIWIIVAWLLNAPGRALLILSVTAVFSLQHWEIQALNRTLMECHKKSILLEVSNEALTASLGEQNRAVQKWEAAQHTKTLLAARALHTAQKRASEHSHDIVKWLYLLPSGDDCVDLRAIINSYIGSRGAKTSLR